MENAGRGARREAVHVPDPDPERLSLELLADVLRERRLSGSRWSGFLAGDLDEDDPPEP